MDRWRLDPKRIEVGADPLACAGFGRQIHFPGEITSERSQKFHRTIARDIRGASLGNSSEAGKEPHIGFHPRGSAGTSDLHDNFRAVE